MLQGAAAHLWRDIVGAADDICEHLAGLVEHGQPKVRGLQRRVVVLGRQQEVLRLQIPAPDSTSEYATLFQQVSFAGTTASTYQLEMRQFHTFCHHKATQHRTLQAKPSQDDGM